MAFSKHLRFGFLAPLAVSLLFSITGPSVAQDGLQPLLDRLRAIQNNPNASAVELTSATIIVDRIVQSYPASEAAVSILLEENYEGIDFASFKARLAAGPATPAPAPQQQTQTTLSVIQPTVQGTPHLDCISALFQPQAQTAIQLSVSTDQYGAVTQLPEFVSPEQPAALVRIDYLGLAIAIEKCAPFSNWLNPGKHVFDVSATGAVGVTPIPDNPVAAAPANTTGLSVLGAPSPQSVPGFEITSAETEAAMQLDRPAVRDLQARLLVMGFDPNGVDGSLGKGARTALSGWQASIGVAATGFLNPPQLENLKQASEVPLTEWLQDPANAAKYNATQAKRKKRRVRVCKRNAIGVLYDCKYRWR